MGNFFNAVLCSNVKCFAGLCEKIFQKRFDEFLKNEKGDGLQAVKPSPWKTKTG